jgi:CopG family nickel-responsive transcriptional regulator
MPDSDLEELEQLQIDGGFSNRSEVVRHAIQSLLAENRSLEGFRDEVTVIVTIIFSQKGKDNYCHQVQHEFNRVISAMMHSHTKEGGCVEVMVLTGNADHIRDFIKKLRTQRQIIRVQVTLVGG